MVNELLQHWRIAVDVLQVFLCLVILFCLMRNRRRKMKSDMMSPGTQNDSDFNFQVFTEAINQQIELAFTNILQVAANERRNLDKVLQFQQHKYLDSGSQQDLPPVPLPHRDDTHDRLAASGSQSDRQARIRQLATRGLSAKQISDELKTPQGEVELVLSLQKK